MLAARNVFAARGYAGASMRVIAAEAGVTAMALYNYAPSKAKLFELVWGESQEALYEGFTKAIAGKATLREEIDAVFDAMYAALHADPEGLTFTSRLLIERDHPELAHLDLHTAPYAQFFRDVTERAVRRGELPQADQLEFVAVVTTLLWGFMSIASLDQNAFTFSVAAAKSAVGRYLSGELGPQ